MLKVIVTTSKGFKIFDEDVLYVEVFYNGVKKYGHTADNVEMGPKTKIVHRQIKDTAKKRMELDPIDQATQFWLDRVRIFWANFFK